MDPTANLREQLQLAARIQRCADREHAACHCRDSADRLADLVQALDQWIQRGGFVPEPWARAGVVPRKGGI